MKRKRISLSKRFLKKDAMADDGCVSVGGLAVKLLGLLKETDERQFGRAIMDRPVNGDLVDIAGEEFAVIRSVEGYRPGNIFVVIDNCGIERLVRRSPMKAKAGNIWGEYGVSV